MTMDDDQGVVFLFPLLALHFSIQIPFYLLVALLKSLIRIQDFNSHSGFYFFYIKYTLNCVAIAGRFNFPGKSIFRRGRCRIVVKKISTYELSQVLDQNYQLVPVTLLNVF